MVVFHDVYKIYINFEQFLLCVMNFLYLQSGAWIDTLSQQSFAQLVSSSVLIISPISICHNHMF